ncbi:MAG TPA: universal stress protein [Kofleriaceae bacterium]|jgi:nucleotide-binding universal stress UspA family protein
MTFKKILCPIDFSTGSQHALAAAIQLAGETKAELVIAHAFYIPPSAFAGQFILPPNAVQEMVEASDKELDDAVALAKKAGVNVSRTLVQDLPWTAIVQLLEHQGFDLCVVGTHGRTGLARVLLGSVTEKVLRHSPCSVLVVRPDGLPLHIAHALVPTDFSSSAERALNAAAELVGPVGAITLLNVAEFPIGLPAEVSFVDYSARMQRDAADDLRTLAGRIGEHSSIAIQTTSRLGSPGAQTLALLDADPTIDIVVMGSHGRTGLKRFLLGSVAEKVVRHARTPVLVIRDGKRE